MSENQVQVSINMPPGRELPVISPWPNNIDVVQTRSEVNGLCRRMSLAASIYAAKQDPTIWKISYTDEENKRRRFVRSVENPDLFIEQTLP